MKCAQTTNAPTDILDSLRSRLNERFGESTSGWLASSKPSPPSFPTGIPPWDAAGGLHQGKLTEACGGSADGALLLESILRQSPRRIAALVDATDALEPADWPPFCMRRILWLRCRAIQEAIRATDLLLRDGNCPLLVLNLQNVPPQKLKPISNSVWHRFHRLVENRPLALLVLSTQPLVQGVRTRIASTTGWNISALNTPRSALLEHLRVRVFKRGSGPHILDEKQSD